MLNELAMLDASSPLKPETLGSAAKKFTVDAITGQITLIE
jgi:hypothetical protein